MRGKIRDQAPLAASLNENSYRLHRALGMGSMLPFSPGTDYENLTKSFRYADGGQVSLDMPMKKPMNTPMDMRGGMIEGEGTGKSDSIPAELPENGYVLPVEVVKAIGKKKLMEMIKAFSNEDVPAMVNLLAFYDTQRKLRR